MGLDLFGFARQFGRASGNRSLILVRIFPMNRHMRIGDRRLLEIFIDAPPAPLEDRG